MKPKLLLIGGGSHCVSCIDVIEAEDFFSIAGIIDQKENIGQKVLDYEVIGSDEDALSLQKDISYCLITLGAVTIPSARKSLYLKYKALGFKFATIKSPTSYVSKHAEIGEGSIIMHNATINARAEISENCIVNNHVLVEHDSKVEEHCHISTSVTINGGCNIGALSFIGSDATLIHGVETASKVIVGAGSVVISNLQTKGTYVGVPCEKIR